MQGGDGPPIVTTNGHTSKKKPPVIAPKPKRSTQSLTLSTSAPHDWQETPSSFTEPARVSGLSPLSSSFRRPQGSRGRKLPSKFSNLPGCREQRRRSKVTWINISLALLAVAALISKLAFQIFSNLWSRKE